MTNSVCTSAPLCSVSASCQMRPSVSFGRFDLSNICLACSPPSKLPGCSCWRSKRPAYWATLSGVRGGIRMGAFPVPWAEMGWGEPVGAGASGGGAGVKPSNRGMGPGCKATCSDGSRPAWACPIRRRAMPKPAGVRKPRFSWSASCQISPSILESSLVFSKNLTAISPVTTPTLSVSACRKSWP